MRTTDPDSTKALQLRAQALALLQEARQLDGLAPFTVTHSHSYGTSTYVLWPEATPDELQAATVLDSQFEPERDERPAVGEGHSLDEMVGVSTASRLPALLESFAAIEPDAMA